MNCLSKRSEWLGVGIVIVIIIASGFDCNQLVANPWPYLRDNYWWVPISLFIVVMVTNPGLRSVVVALTIRLLVTLTPVFSIIYLKYYLPKTVYHKNPYTLLAFLVGLFIVVIGVIVWIVWKKFLAKSDKEEVEELEEKEKREIWED